MMKIDLFIVLCKSFTLFIYGTIFIISIIFTFCIDIYSRLDELLNLKLLSSETINPLDQNIDFIEDWLNANHRVIGPILILLSLFDMVMLFKVIDFLL